MIYFLISHFKSLVVDKPDECILCRGVQTRQCLIVTMIAVAGIIMEDAYMCRPDIIADGDCMNN